MTDDGARTSRPAHAERAAGWVLHTLDEADEAEFLAHLELEGCEECAQVVAETASTLEALARAVPQEEPPADLRYRLLLAAEAERPVDDDVRAARDVPFTRSAATRDTAARDGHRPVAPRLASVPSVPSGVDGAKVDGTSGARRDNGSAALSAPSDDELSASVLPMRRRQWVRRAMASVAAAAAVVVIGGLVVSNQSLRAERDDQATTVQAYDRIVDVMRDAGSPGAVSAPLATPDGALVGMVVDQGSDPEVLTTGLGENPTDHTYVLWALAGPTPTAVGVFDVPDGAASVRSVPSYTAAGPVAGYAVSLEPGRSAPAAPTRIVASGQVGR